MPSVSNLPPLPGFGLNLDCEDGNESLFPSALDPEFQERECKSRCVDASFLVDLCRRTSAETLMFLVRLPILTLREIAMLQFMNVITDKSEWERKVQSFI
jgi:hypothetical protein